VKWVTEYNSKRQFESPVMKFFPFQRLFYNAFGEISSLHYNVVLNECFGF